MDDSSNEVSLRAFKIILVGPQGVGKSSILNRLTDSKFNINYMPTVGIDFKTHQVKAGSKSYSLQIWDTAGQQKFRALTGSYFKGSNGCVCVFDLNEVQTLAKCEYYLQKALGEGIQPQCIYLIGNKSDLGEQHVRQGQKFAEKFSVNYSSVSAKEGKGINQIFNSLTMRLIQNAGPQQNPPNLKIRPNVVIKQRQSRCGC